LQDSSYAHAAARPIRLFQPIVHLCDARIGNHESGREMWTTEVWHAVQGEFADLVDAAEAARLLVRLSVAVLLAAVIGYDRERHASSAGLRTHMLVALGAALFVIVPQHAGFDATDMSRVVQGVIAGIGFLGAGAIIKLDDRREIKGLTTAASIWLTAALGMTAGLGQLATAIVGTLIGLIVLAVLPAWEQSIKDDPPRAADPQREPATRSAAD
jgi:putative Mg2+ transporter-C (MgtC) family protein